MMRFFIDTNCRSGAGTTQTHRALVHYKTILSIYVYMPHDPLGMRFVYSSSAPLYPLVLMGQPHLKCLYAILDVEFADLCIPITFPRYFYFLFVFFVLRVLFFLFFLFFF